MILNFIVGDSISDVLRLLLIDGLTKWILNPDMSRQSLPFPFFPFNWQLESLSILSYPKHHWHSFPLHHCHTTRKPEKSNGITDGIFLSVIYTDRNNFVSKSVGIYRRIYSVGNSIGIYWRFRWRRIQFVWKYATAWWRQAILPTEITKGFKLR
jgi:hypothetical protein